MVLTQREKFIRNGKKGARIRWNKEHKAIIDNLKKKNKLKDLLLKAMICGFLAADGRVVYRRENRRKASVHYEVNFYPDHKSLVKIYLDAFEYLYKKRPKVIEQDNHYRIKAQCKIACLDLLEISKFGTYDWEVPLDFLKNEKMKKEWLRAFFDGDGSVGDRQIQVQSVNRNGIYQVKKLLEEFQIKSNICTYERKNKNWNTNYILFITHREHRKQFEEKIGFNHEAKLLKLCKQNLLTKKASVG